MKKTIIINISGIVFHIDEDAYGILEKYLESLNHYFGNTNEGKEIVTDIESRIAELLQPKINDAKQSVSIEDVSEILSILGTPEDIAGSESSSFEQEPSVSDYNLGKRMSRRLYRDIDNSVIGGVCSGLGAYFKIDSVFFRIIFIALIFAGGVSLIIYPILWIVVPAARTSAQKLEMRGQDVNLSNIEKTVREEFLHIKSNMNKPDSTWNRIGEFFREIFNFIGILIRGIFNVLRYIIGIFLVLMAIFFSVALIGALYFKNFAIHGDFNDYFTSVQDFLYHVISPVTADTMLLLLFVILVIPIAGLVYLGLKLLIRFETRQKWIILVISAIWFLSVISFSVLLFNEVDNLRSENRIKETVNLPLTKNNTLFVSAPASDEKDGDFIEFFGHSRLFFPLNQSNKEQLAGVVTIDVEKTNANSPEMQIIREARGEDRSEALESARKVQFEYTLKDSLVSLNPFFRVAGDDRWKFYRTRIVFRLPVGTKIFFNKNVKHLLLDIDNNVVYWHQNMADKTWIMTENGLELFGASSSEIKLLNDYGERILNLQVRDKNDIDRDRLDQYRNGEHYGNLTVNGQSYYYGTISLDVRKSETNRVQIELIKTASGTNSIDAQQLSKAIEYNFEQNDSLIWLDPVFRFPANQKWSNQKLTVVVRLPINKRIYLSKDSEPMIENLASSNDKWSGEFVNHTYKMGNEGLVNLDE